jgi:hypothetical protein
MQPVRNRAGGGVFAASSDRRPVPQIATLGWRAARQFADALSERGA